MKKHVWFLEPPPPEESYGWLLNREPWHLPHLWGNEGPKEQQPCRCGGVCSFEEVSTDGHASFDVGINSGMGSDSSRFTGHSGCHGLLSLVVSDD